MPALQTPHFRVNNGKVEPRFPGAGVDNELADHIVAELAPLGLVPDGKAFERIFVEIVLATQPTPVLAWTGFYRNTLRRLRRPHPDGDDSVSTFGRIYAHVSSLIRGMTVLDVGCCFGFLPMLLTERDPRLKVIGTDVARGAAALAGMMARAQGNRARFVSGDVLRLPAGAEAVDTALAIHLLEHLPAESASRALAQLCSVARRRVVVAVPLEDAPNTTYGHVQAFDLCALAELGGATGWPQNVYSYHGGWLVLDRA